MYLDFAYYTPTKVVFGKGAEAQVGALVKEQGCKKHPVPDYSKHHYRSKYHRRKCPYKKIIHSSISPIKSYS